MRVNPPILINIIRRPAVEVRIRILPFAHNNHLEWAADVIDNTVNLGKGADFVDQLSPKPPLLYGRERLRCPVRRLHRRSLSCRGSPARNRGGRINLTQKVGALTRPRLGAHPAPEGEHANGAGGAPKSLPSELAHIPPSLADSHHENRHKHTGDHRHRDHPLRERPRMDGCVLFAHRHLEVGGYNRQQEDRKRPK